MPKDLEKLRIKIGWILLEHKCLYYTLVDPKYSTLRIPDYKYDFLENTYISLCRKLNKKDSVSSMVGFDKKRPSCKLVYDKLKSTKRRMKINSVIEEIKKLKP